MDLLRLKTVVGPNIYEDGPVILGTLRFKVMGPAASERVLRDLKNYFPGLPLDELEPTGNSYMKGVFGICQQLSEILKVPPVWGRVLRESRTRDEVEVTFVKPAPALPGNRLLLDISLAMFEHVLREENYPLGLKINEVRDLLDQDALGPSTQAIVSAAERRGIPWRRLNTRNLIEFGYGSQIRRIEATSTSLTSLIGVEIAQDKDLTKRLLKRGGIRVPEGRLVRTEAEALEFFRESGGPVALKPVDGHHGQGVELDLRTETDLLHAFQRSRGHSKSGDLIIEEFFNGNDYRLLVINGSLRAATHRTPAHVVGDGKSTLLELVDAENRNPLRGEGHDRPLTRIQIDDEAKEFLRRAGISTHAIPAEGQTVYLHATANISTGGTGRDVTDLVHPEIRQLAERAALMVGLDVCGIDLIAEDIRRPLSSQIGGVIEVNAGPGIRMHHYPAEGEPRDVGAAIMESLYPDGANGRIPIFAVTGTNGKTTVTRLLSHILSTAGYSVGMTTTDGVHVGGKCVMEGDTTGPVSAEVVLTDPSVEVAVLETARGGIVKRGLGYDWSDVGIITNIEADHLGQDGIETVEDILRIKSLIARRVREGGTVILNADDPRLVELARHPDLRNRQIVFFSVQERNPVIVDHTSEGGTAYFMIRGELVEYRAGALTSIAVAESIPLTYGGSAIFQVANILAAAAAYRVLPWSGTDLLMKALKTFDPGAMSSGRGNLYHVGNGFVLVDYGHNPHALQAISRTTRQWKSRRTTAVISVPGDRSDEMIRMSGRIAAEGFDQVVVREDIDLRGREPGETGSLICAAIREVSPGANCRLIPDEREAFRTAVREMSPGEVVVFFYDDLDVVKELLEEQRAVPARNLIEVVAGAESPAAVRLSAVQNLS